MVFARFTRKQQPPKGRSAPRGCCFLLNLAKTISTNNPYAPMLPFGFLRPFLVLAKTKTKMCFLLGPANTHFVYQRLEVKSALSRAAKACTNTKRGYKKQGGSIGAYGVLVHMVFARCQTKQQPPTGRSAPCGCRCVLHHARTICTNNAYAPMLPPCFAKPFLVFVHSLAAPNITPEMYRKYITLGTGY